MNSPIRLAMIRCDIHGYFFGPFLSRMEPARLAAHCHLIHRLLADQEDGSRLRVKPISGFKVTKVWDPVPAEAEQFADTFAHRPEVCQDLRQVVHGVDAAFISNCSLDGSDHLALARPMLRAGLPLFVDKPLAGSYRDAKAIVRLAEEHGTPLMAASLVTYCDSVEHQRKRRGELGRLGLAILRGSHGWETREGLEGITHGIAAALAVYGHGADWVECMGELPREFILLHYPHGGKVLVINMDQTYWPDTFQAEAWGQSAGTNPPGKTHVRGRSIGEEQYLAAGTRLVRQFRQMVRSGQPPTPYAHLLEWTRIAEAARRAQESGQRVYLSRLR